MTIVVLTGAGLSAEAGIRTFRASDGLWEAHRIEDVATPQGFVRDPLLVQRFYNARRAQLGRVRPTGAHEALARMQRDARRRVVLITQNVDDLHERAGSEVIHMHGQLRRMWCRVCDSRMPWQGACFPETRCPLCHRRGGLRVDVVWFGEIPYHLEEIERALREAGVFAAIGTSGLVYPAAGFVQLARAAGAHTIEFNLEKTAASSRFDEAIYAPASRSIPRWVEAMLG